MHCSDGKSIFPLLPQLHATPISCGVNRSYRPKQARNYSSEPNQSFLTSALRTLHMLGFIKIPPKHRLL